MSERFTLGAFEFFTRELRTRFPFRYGIASMTDVPHLFVRVQIRRNGANSLGLAAEGLPPKWFTKNPATTFAADLVDMRRVIDHAAELATEIARTPVTFFEFSRELSRQQQRWANAENFPPLLAGLGVSLCERAVLDALARSLQQPVHRLVQENLLGVRLAEIYPELRDAEPRDLLPASPRTRVHVRHTLGLTDPLTPEDIPAGERVDDGLPQDLQSSVRAYGLRYFKIKLIGDSMHDRDRLRGVTHLLDREARGDWFATVDGNENFKSFTAFREFWESLASDPLLHDFKKHLLVVEQPVHRDHALNDEAANTLGSWPDRPPLIIDESDGAIGDLTRALALGYTGTSHKNCKGIVKGLANACLLAHRRGQGRAGMLTGEDLCNLGPVALLQDLAIVSLLGIEHVERNGHHYYRGLSMWPTDWQDTVRAIHGDIYEQHPQGFACLRIRDGGLALDSVNAAPFGVQPLLDPGRFSDTPSH
jgi:hypothetical protein